MEDGPDKSNAGANRDSRFWPYISDNLNLRRILEALGYSDYALGSFDDPVPEDVSALIPSRVGVSETSLLQANGQWVEPAGGGGPGVGSGLMSTAILDGKADGEEPVTSLPLVVASDSLPLTSGPDDVGVPVFAPMKATRVAVSWQSDNTSSPPSGDWTLRLHKRERGGQMAEVATFAVKTDNL